MLAALKKLLFLYRYSRRDEWHKIGLYELGSVGDRIRITGMVDFGSEPYLIQLGSDVTLTSGVAFVTHDGGAAVLRRRHPGLNRYAPITIGDRVFVGTRAIILPGVRIGSDVVIGAGSVVTRDIPDGTVAAGVPCRPIRSIEEYEQRLLADATYWDGRSSRTALRSEILAGLDARGAAGGR